MTSERQVVGHISEVPEGGQLKVDLAGREILVCQLEGAYYAIDYYCSHDYLGLEGGTLENGCITCPYHGAEFCLKTGEALASPAWEPIAVYPVALENDLITLEIPSTT